MKSSEKSHTKTASGASPMSGANTVWNNVAATHAPSVPWRGRPGAPGGVAGQSQRLKPPQPGRDWIDAQEREAEQLVNRALGKEDGRPKLSAQAPEITSHAQKCLDDSQEAGESLPASVRSFFEPRFGHSFSRVRVHADITAARLARDLHAQAFTYGTHIYFGAGRYQPDAWTGRQLIAHELGHVASLAPLGPATPLLQSAPASEEQRLSDLIDSLLAATSSSDRKKKEEELEKRLTGSEPLQTEARQLLTARLDLLPVTTVKRKCGQPLKKMPQSAERQRAEALLKKFVEKYPGQLEQVEDEMLAATKTEREAADQGVRTLWSHYVEAAYLKAILQWNAKQKDILDKRRKKRGAKAKFTVDEQARYDLLQKLSTSTESQYAGLRAGHADMCSTALYGLDTLMRTSEPVSYINEDFLAELSRSVMQAGLAFARRERFHTTEYLNIMRYVPSPQVVEKYAKAKTAAAKPGAAPLTAAATKDPELRALLLWFNTDLSQTGESLRESSGARDEGLEQAWRTIGEAGEDVLMFARGMGEEDRWWIYQQALLNIEEGFDEFSMENIYLTVLEPRANLVSGRMGVTGIEYRSGEIGIVGTYGGHGIGQFDVAASEDRLIHAVAPETIDLSLILGPHPLDRSRVERIFKWKDGQVTSVREVDPESSEDTDVLAKLYYGFFGRSWKHEKINEYLDDPAKMAALKRTPAAARVLAALLLVNTVEGSTLSPGLLADIVDIYTKLDKDLREALKRDYRVEVPDTDTILTPAVIGSDLPALAKPFIGKQLDDWREGMDLVEASSLVKLDNPKTKKKFTKSEAVKLVLDNALPAILADRSSGSTRAIETFMIKLRGDLVDRLIDKSSAGGTTLSEADAKKRIGKRGGPMIEVTHRFEETVSIEGVDHTTTVWIKIGYIHLRETTAKKGAPISAGTPPPQLGFVGLTGNAVSPHVHMYISVYEKQPGSADPIGYLDPIDFFPMMRSDTRRLAEPVPTPTAPAP